MDHDHHAELLRIRAIELLSRRPKALHELIEAIGRDGGTEVNDADGWMGLGTIDNSGLNLLKTRVKRLPKQFDRLIDIPDTCRSRHLAGRSLQVLLHRSPLAALFHEHKQPDLCELSNVMVDRRRSHAQRVGRLKRRFRLVHEFTEDSALLSVSEEADGDWIANNEAFDLRQGV